MGVGTFKDRDKSGKARTRYRVTFRRHGRRLVDERLPPGTTKDQADQLYAAIVRDWFDRERLGLQAVPLIATVIRHYETHRKPTLKSPRFATHCIAVLAKHAIGKRMDELPEVAQAVAKAVAHQSPATIAHRVSFVRMLGRYALKIRIDGKPIVDRDYGVGIERPAFNNERQFYIDKLILAKILRHAAKPIRRACWQLFYSGMRRGELYAAVVTGDAYVLADTKNGDPRIVPIPTAVRKFAGRPTITRNPLSRGFKRAAKAAGYGHLHLHDLRHSTASQLLNAGADLGVVGMILGHRKPSSTRRYAHLATSTARAWLNFAARGAHVTDGKGGLAGRPPEPGKKKVA